MPLLSKEYTRVCRQLCGHSTRPIFLNFQSASHNSPIITKFLTLKLFTFFLAGMTRILQKIQLKRTQRFQTWSEFLSQTIALWREFIRKIKIKIYFWLWIVNSTRDTFSMGTFTHNIFLSLKINILFFALQSPLWTNTACLCLCPFMHLWLYWTWLSNYYDNCCTVKIHFIHIENNGSYLELFAGCPNDPEPLLCVVLQQHGELSWNWWKNQKQHLLFNFRRWQNR